MTQTGSVASKFRCIECNKTVKREDILWAHKGEQFDEATCICESCLPKWNAKINPPSFENINNTEKRESFIAHYIKHIHDKWVEHRHEKQLAESEHLLTKFIRASIDDPSMGSILLAIASLNKSERHDLLDLITTQLEGKKAHPELINALHDLKLDNIAAKVIANAKPK